MGACLSKQTKPSGKPDHLRQEPESYSNETAYFIQQIIQLITHEFHDEPPDTANILLLTYIYFSDFDTLFTAIRERFFIEYENYSFLTYQQEENINNPPPPQINEEKKESTPLKPKPVHNVSQDSHSENNATMDIPDTQRKDSFIDRKIVYIPTKQMSKPVWISEVKIPIQRKCLELLLLWIEQYWTEDWSTENIEKLKEFATQIKEKRDNIMQDEDEKNEHLNNSYSTFLQEYIFKMDNIVNTQQEWYKNVMIDLKNKQAEQQKLFEEQVKKSKHYFKNRKGAVTDAKEAQYEDAGAANENSVSQSRRGTITFSDNLMMHNFDYEDDAGGMSESESSNPNENGIDISSNSLIFITVKNRSNAIKYAKQLTLLDWDYFVAIKAREILSKILVKKHENSLGLKIFIDRFKQTHQYVIVSIMAAPNLKSRIEMIDFFIFVAENLLKLNNLHSFMAVTTALDSINVQKLETCWKHVNVSNLRKFSSFLSPLCSSRANFQQLRKYVNKMKPPGIPFLGLILQDVTFCHDGNKDRLKKSEDEHINWRKYHIFHSICKNVIFLQNGSYSEMNEHIEAVYDENDARFLEKQQTESVQNSQYLMNDVIEYLSDADNNNGDRSREGSISREVSYSFGNKQFGIHGDSFNLVHDFELQQAITKDFHSYILLSRAIIKAMRNEANRRDAMQEKEYLKSLQKEKEKGFKVQIDDETATTKKKKGIFRRWKRKLSNSKKKKNKMNVSPKNIMPVSPVDEDCEK